MDLNAIGNVAINIGFMIGTILLGGGIVIGAIWGFLRFKRYSEYECIIYKRAGFDQWTQHRDKAGIFVDPKTKNKLFFMKKANVGLKADNIPYIMGTKGQKTVYLIQYGLKNFRFMKMVPTTESFEITVGEDDVNWALNAFDRQKKAFGETLLIQLLPYIGIAFVTVAILVIFIYFFKDFAVLKDVAISLKDAATEIARAKTGTTVITP